VYLLIQAQQLHIPGHVIRFLARDVAGSVTVPGAGHPPDAARIKPLQHNLVTHDKRFLGIVGLNALAVHLLRLFRRSL